MPTYGYLCKSCSFEFEEFQKISDETLRRCPKCKKKSLIRIIGGGAGLVFKGSGFYLTDYKKSSTSTSDSSSAPSKKSEPTADTKSSKKDSPAKKTSSPDSSSSSSEK
ncbi:MAG TPA: zinc ribbon domain-containing protein [Bacteroidota bacterium]|nr:zinc ribbon domain-containing protein [Bacteroidota bacterium]